MNDECLICGAPLEYLPEAVEMECRLCRRRELSQTRCVNGHYVCDKCHSAGLDAIVSVCLREDSKDPIAILEKLMAQPFCHMHGPEHHTMVGAALLTAYRNAGGEVDLEHRLLAMLQRGGQIPGGVCGFWGACGAGISAGIFVSLISGASPLSTEAWGLSNLMTSRALGVIGEIGGPRCCKRDSFLAVLTAVDFVKEHFGVEMEKPDIVCTYAGKNNQCIGKRCPFSAAKRRTDKQEP